MSYDYAFWESVDPLEDEEAEAIYVDLIEHGQSPRVLPSPKIAEFLQAIRARWPDLSDDKEEISPWASDFDVSDAHLIVAVLHSREDQGVGQFLCSTALRMELVYYDPQQESIFLPRRLSQKRTRLRAKRKKGKK